LASHQSIVNFLGLLWENEEEIGPKQNVFPGILIEQADLGSLDQFLLRTRYNPQDNLSYEVKRSLDLCVALGHDVLRTCGIVHGDLKPDKILVFIDAGMPGGVRAKLTDFGLSVFLVADEHEAADQTNAKFIPAFATWDWNAPELLTFRAGRNESHGYLIAEEMI
jgi:serine/threonine protein kinase